MYSLQGGRKKSDPESCRWKGESGLAALGVGHPDGEHDD